MEMRRYGFQSMEAENNNARANATRLMGFIFKYWVSEPVFSADQKEALSMLEELMAELYARMMALMTDKVRKT